MLACVALAVLAPAVGLGAPSARSVAALRERAATVMERQDRFSREGIGTADAVLRELRAVADSLRAAGLDTLESRVRYGAGRLLARLGRANDAQRELTLGIAAALRGRARLEELACRKELAEGLCDRDPETAIHACRDMLPRARATGNAGLVGGVYSTMSRAQGLLGRWTEALQSARECDRWYARTDNPRDRVQPLSQATQALRMLERFDEALALNDTALAIARRGTGQQGLSRALFERMVLLRRQQRFAEALATSAEILAIDRRTGNAQHEQSVRLARTSVLIEMDRHAAVLAETDTIAALGYARENPVLELRTASARARSLFELERFAEADTLLARAIARYETRRADLDTPESRAASGGYAEWAYAIWTETRLRVAGPEAAWAVFERSRARALKSQMRVTDVPLAVLFAHLRPAHAALIGWTEQGAYPALGFVLADGHVEVMTLGEPRLGADVRTVIDRVMSSSPGPALDRALAHVAEARLAPLLAKVPAGIERLVVLPSSELAALPFEMLPVHGGTVGERWAVSYLPAASLLPALDARQPAAGEPVAFADPAPGSLGSLAAVDRSAASRRLPHALAEARRAVGARGQVYRGGEATDARLRERSPGASVLHFATHAIASPERADHTAIVLAGPDGCVTAAEVESLRVGADLVVLSGCRTAGGPVYAGEGVFGFARSFLVAGARSVLATRWPVGDRAAARGMAVFYDGLRAGLPRDESLRRARRALVAEGFPLRDCSAFTLTGLADAPVRALSDARVE